jgi:hypothetical protein
LWTSTLFGRSANIVPKPLRWRLIQFAKKGHGFVLSIGSEGHCPVEAPNAHEKTSDSTKLFGNHVSMQRFQETPSIFVWHHLCPDRNDGHEIGI